MKTNTLIRLSIALLAGTMVSVAYATNGNAEAGDGDSPKERKIDKKAVERYRKAAENGDVEACEALGWEYEETDKAEAVKWWCRAGCRGSDMMKAVLRLMFNGKAKDRALIFNAAGVVTATGGCPLPDSTEPLAWRVERGRRAYIDKWLGFSEPTLEPFPTLATVTNATGIKLDFAERFEDAVKGKMALFPDGGIRWTENGTNGLSFAETDIKVRKFQIKCVREMMEGRKIANKAGTAWVLNDDFTFGYMPWHDLGNNDKEVYVFSIRHEMNGKPPKACVLVAFAPTQMISNSIIGAFLGDETAKSNVKAMEKIGILIVMDD